MAQVVPLPLTISCFSKFRLVLPSWFYLSSAGSSGWSRTRSKGAVEWFYVSVCVIAVSGWIFLLVLAHPGCPRQSPESRKMCCSSSSSSSNLRSRWNHFWVKVSRTIIPKKKNKKNDAGYRLLFHVTQLNTSDLVKFSGLVLDLSWHFGLSAYWCHYTNVWM